MINLRMRSKKTLLFRRMKKLSDDSFITTRPKMRWCWIWWKSLLKCSVLARVCRRCSSCEGRHRNPNLSKLGTIKKKARNRNQFRCFKRRTNKVISWKSWTSKMMWRTSWERRKCQLKIHSVKLVKLHQRNLSCLLLHRRKLSKL